jgi:hypothetical protein
MMPLNLLPRPEEGHMRPPVGGQIPDRTPEFLARPYVFTLTYGGACLFS